MAEITRKRQGELIAGVFRLQTQQQVDGLPAKEVLARLRAEVRPTPFEASDYPNHSGVNRYEKIVRFSMIPFVNAGWLTKKGHWSVTECFASQRAFFSLKICR